MTRYRLDDLGWYQFEELVQSLLKVVIRWDVQSWGGRGDWGRDAYHPGSLIPPGERKRRAGPWIFQVKFIEGANAAGSRPTRALFHAVQAERESIRARHPGRVSRVREYVFITNATLDPFTRKRIEEALRPVLPMATISSFGGKDLCNWLDNNPDIRRAYPNLLSLSDLDALIESALNHEQIQRSRVAIELGRALSPLFVVTGPFRQARALLGRHHFVCLEGPPEMGKTAIARMIGLLYLELGWQVYEAPFPQDFLKLLRRRDRQVFICDDAFGRTEYDTDRGRAWEIEMERVLHAVDDRHLLILTCRKHILERAIEEMDLPGSSAAFPKPADVFVDTSLLSRTEKATILYRHAKAVGLSREAKELVRSNADQIVGNPHFTPERIRRFVKEELPDLTGRNDLSGSIVEERIGEALRNPTEGMRKSFRGLDPAEKWLLTAMLEMDFFEGDEVLRKKYEELCPDRERRPFYEVHRGLKEGFIKSSSDI